MKRIILFFANALLHWFCITALCVFTYIWCVNKFDAFQTFVIVLFMGIDCFVWYQIYDLINHGISGDK